jgi:hypothetical protein
VFLIVLRSPAAPSAASTRSLTLPFTHASRSLGNMVGILLETVVGRANTQG